MVEWEQRKVDRFEGYLERRKYRKCQLPGRGEEAGASLQFLV